MRKIRTALGLALAAMLMLGMFLPAGLSEAATELKVLGFWAGVVRPNEDPVEDEIDKATGYRVTYAVLPQANEEERLYLEMASGEVYDIIKIKPKWYYKLLGEGALMPLTGLLNEHGGNLLANIKESSWEIATLDGEIYGIPQMDERAIISNGLLYREDILKEMGREEPSTVAELIDLLQAVKKAYPDMIPMTSPLNVWSPTLLSPFGLHNEWIDVDGQLVHRSQHPNAKAYVSLLRELYEKQLIDVDFPILNQTVVQEKFSTGKAFSYLNYIYTQGEFFMPVLLQNFPGATVEMIDPLVGENGEKGFDTSVKMKYVSCIPRASKKAVDAVKFMNAKMDTDTFRFLTMGTEGVTYNKEGNRYTPIMPIFSELRNTAYWYMNGMDEYNYPDYWLARLRRNEYVGGTFDMMNANFAAYDSPNPAAAKPSIDSFAEYETFAANLLSDGIIQIVAGTRDLDYYDALAKEWLAEGGMQMTEDVNAWYATRKK